MLLELESTFSNEANKVVRSLVQLITYISTSLEVISRFGDQIYSSKRPAQRHSLHTTAVGEKKIN